MIIRFPDASVVVCIQLGTSEPSFVVSLKVIASLSPSLNVDFKIVYVSVVVPDIVILYVIIFSIVALFTGISFESLTYSFIVVDVVSVPLAAVIFKISGSPTAFAGGFPLKVLVAALKTNQVGSALPSPKVALYVKVVANGFVNVSAGII